MTLSLEDKISFFRNSILPLCLTATTAYQPERWSLYRPTTGHCALVSYFLYTQVGGRIMRCTVRHPNGFKELHYFNEIGGQTVDCTADQFNANVVFEDVQEREPERTLDDDATRHRYAMFERRLLYAMKTKGFSFSPQQMAS